MPGGGDRWSGGGLRGADQPLFGSLFIAMVMVGSQFRRHGLGHAVILHLRAACTGSKLFSSTNMSNVPMQALLIKAGFKPSGYIDNLDENDPKIVFYAPIP
jgi:ribosomal protein S18 acetylase RimI-like enzyme